ncbi:NAD(P)/FAD-dependent oxidoreductase [Desulfotalea psychrophila]|uniref:Related to opine/octopine dehydrogenase, subunit B n=1 Tax=Desulfotalea psychrophila (strain LSv54 / DSM 12343) TaxID=177439 RepID=Q6AKZ8_DESPS|nr:FAD-dependent oxidoreductase [Desulfotalea psychrophila]CAG36977.1 related to opine/octopine dehydrogenase, subunit B [Desulfotalea psychrophila LSv54]
MNHSADVLVIGAGVTGAAIAYGLTKKNKKVVLIDAPPNPIDRSSRANMGLIWCQSKALGNRPYAEWNFESSKLFPELIPEIEELTGIDTMYKQCGGIIPTVGEADYDRRANYLKALDEEAKKFGATKDYPGEMYSRSQLEAHYPGVTFGKEVTGGTWCPEDGHIEPLQLMFALRLAMKRNGGTFLPHCAALDIARNGDSYTVHTSTGTIECERLVITAGLGSKQLANQFGINVPIYANKSQLFLTERIPNLLPTPLLGITRTDGGTVMVGFEHEYMGNNTELVPERLQHVANWAHTIWPAIAKLRVIRCWTGLRVWPKDGFPIYDAIPNHKNAFIFNAHSGVTLAAVQAKHLPEFILGGKLPKNAQGFGLDRFPADA